MAKNNIQIGGGGFVSNILWKFVGASCVILCFELKNGGDWVELSRVE